MVSNMASGSRSSSERQFSMAISRPSGAARFPHDTHIPAMPRRVRSLSLRLTFERRTSACSLSIRSDIQSKTLDRIGERRTPTVAQTLAGRGRLGATVCTYMRETPCTELDEIWRRIVGGPQQL